MDFMTRNSILKNIIKNLTDNAEKPECYPDEHMNLVDWNIIMEAYRDTLHKPENSAG